MCLSRFIAQPRHPLSHNLPNSRWQSPNNADLTPPQLAQFYRNVGGNYDALFLDTPPSSLAFIYKSLGCLHSLQPVDESSAAAHAAPAIPALKPRGFVTWQSIQLLLGPHEHVPFLQEALRLYDIRDPAHPRHAPFAKNLPAATLPAVADADMLSWHASVAERLRAEAAAAATASTSVDADHAHPRHHRPRLREPDGTASPPSPASSPDARADAASFFSNPLYRGRDGRPGVVRRLTRAPQAILQSVIGIAGPLLGAGDANTNSSTRHDSRSPDKRSRSRTRSRSRDSHASADSHAPTPSRARPRHRPRTQREHDRDRDREQQHQPAPRRHRSHDPARPQPCHFPPPSSASAAGWETDGEARARAPRPAVSRRPAPEYYATQTHVTRGQWEERQARQWDKERQWQQQAQQAQQQPAYVYAYAHAGHDPGAASLLGAGARNEDEEAGFAPSESPPFAVEVTMARRRGLRAATMAGGGAAGRGR